MRFAVTILGLLFSLLLMGCTKSACEPFPPIPKVPNQEIVISPSADIAGKLGSPIPLKSFVLSEVGFFRGQALWVAEDRTAIVQVIGRPPGGESRDWEKRYKFKLTAEEWAETERLVGVHNFLTIQKQPEGSGILDEAQPIIVLITKAGTTIKARKWAHEKHPDFDPVYMYLRGLCRAEGATISEGRYVWKWQPDGFSISWK